MIGNNKAVSGKYQPKRHWVLLISIAVLLMPWTVNAEEEFFDKKLVISDKELEKLSDEPETVPPAEVPRNNVKPALKALQPMTPLPVTPYIITPLPSQQPSQHSSIPTDTQVEILMEEPPLSDEKLQGTDDNSQVQPVEQPAETLVSNQKSTMSSEDLIEKMLRESEQGTQGITPPASQPEPFTPAQPPQQPIPQKPASQPVVPEQPAVKPEPAPAPAPQPEVLQELEEPEMPASTTTVPEPVVTSPPVPQQAMPPVEVVPQPAPIVLPQPVVPTPQEPIILPEGKKTLSEEAATLPSSLPPSQPEVSGAAPTPPTASLDTWTGSIMFAPDEYQMLRQAISVYERITGRKTVSTATGPATKNPTSTGAGRTPAFYLGSIAYISPEQWAVWLNNKKYTAKKATDEVTIIDVTSDNVRMTWKVDSLDIVIPDWRSKLIINNAGYYVSSDNLIEVNNVGSEITFTLRPNQSFVSSRMKVVEGRAEDAFSLSIQ